MDTHIQSKLDSPVTQPLNKGKHSAVEFGSRAEPIPLWVRSTRSARVNSRPSSGEKRKSCVWETSDFRTFKGTDLQGTISTSWRQFGRDVCQTCVSMSA